ncbi:MAG: hypothetical protein AAFZ07_26495 [Actinomycetota bacterium]
MSPRLRLVLLGLAATVTVAAAVVLASSGGESGEEAVSPPTTAVPVATTVVEVTAAPVETVAPPEEPTPTPPPPPTEPPIGEHPVCELWDVYAADLEVLPVDTPDDLRRLNERRIAFFSEAVAVLDGDERRAAAHFLTYHEDLAAFWPPFGWDPDAYTLALIEDPDGAPELPWPDFGADARWRQTLTDRCGLEFEIEDTT